MKYKLIADLEKAQGNINNGFVSNVEKGGLVHGRIEDDKGNILGTHTSTTLTWLQSDLLNKVSYDSKTDTYIKNWEDAK